MWKNNYFQFSVERYSIPCFAEISMIRDSIRGFGSFVEADVRENQLSKGLRRV